MTSLLVSADDLVAWGRFNLGVMDSLWLVRILDVVFMRLLLHVTLLWKLLDCPACGRKQEKRLLKQVSSASFLEQNPCLAQHCSAVGQRDLEGTFLTWSVSAVLAPASAFWQMILVLDHRTLVGLRDLTLGCRSKQLLDEDTDSLCWSRCVLPPDLKETRN